MAIKWNSESEAQPTPTPFSIDSRGKGIKWDMNQSQGALSQSQSMLDNIRKTAFQSPLQNIASGNATDNTEIAIGASKQARKDISMAGAQYAGPVGKTMIANAPEFAKNIESFEQSVTPSNPLQAQGAMSTSIAEAAIPLGAAKATGVLSKIGEKTGISGFLAKRADKKAVDTALKSITPRTNDLTPTEYEQLLARKRITPKTTFKPSTYILSDSEKATASKYKDILQDKDPVKNSINVMSKIADEDAEVGKFLEQNNSIFNSGELKNAVAKRMEDITDVTIPEERIAKLKTQITDNFVSSLKKNDMKTLWEARKEFDQQIESAFSGSPTLQKEVKKRFRKAIQEYISENTPDGVYAQKMRDMTNLFDIEDVVSTRASKEKGANAIQVWIKENPTKAKVIGLTVPIVGTGIYLSN